LKPPVLRRVDLDEVDTQQPGGFFMPGKCIGKIVYFAQNVKMI